MKHLLHEQDGPIHTSGYGADFQRALDGSVLIEVGGAVIELPPAAWAAAVAAVSVRGETLDTQGEALQFHQRRE